MSRLLAPSIARYKKRYLTHDIIAALTVTAISIPESLAFAAIAGLPPVTGLYTAVLGPVVFGLIAHSRRLVVGADSATAALIASGAVLIAQAGTVGYANAVALIGLLTAVLLVAMAVFRMGFLADLISRPVLVGFLAGVGVQLIVTRFPAMTGIETHGSLWQHLVTFFQRLDSINGLSLTVAILVVGVIVLTRRTRIPGELLGLVAAMLFAGIFQLGKYGVAFVGALPTGLPGLAVPSFSAGDIVTLLPAALGIALVILAQSSSVVRSLGGEHDDKIRLNQDLLALGAANAASALTHGFVVNGSPPRSYAADAVGGKSQMTNVLMGLIIGTLLLFGTKVFAYLPEAALAAIICMLGVRLIRFEELRYLWETHRAEFFVAMVALVVTALFGVRLGILIAVIVSLMERLSRQYRPKDDILLRDGVLSDWAKDRLSTSLSDISAAKGLLIYNFDGSLFFENSTYFAARIRRAIERAKEPVNYVLIDAGAIDSIDYTAVERLKLLYRELDADDVQLGFAHVSPHLFSQLDEYGVIDLMGEKHIFSTLNAAVKAYPKMRVSIPQLVRDLKLPADEYVIIGGAVLEMLHLRKTNDVDLIVSDELYKKFRDEKHWKEYALPSGKKMLSHEGYNMMRTWMGYSFSRIKKDSFEIDGLPLIDIEQLIECKRHLDRRKDATDIAMLKKYLSAHPSLNASR